MLFGQGLTFRILSLCSLIALFTETFAQTPQLQDDRCVSLRMRYEQDTGQLTVLSQRLVTKGSLQQRRSGPQPGELLLRFEDTAGQILSEQVVPDATIVYYDNVVFKNTDLNHPDKTTPELTGGIIKLTSGDFQVIIPFSRKYSQVRLLKPDFALESEVPNWQVLGLSAIDLSISPAFSKRLKAKGWDSETVLDNGDPDKRIDIVVLGDGYTAGEMAQYKADVQKIIVEDFFKQTPLLEYKQFFNVHRVDVISNESGVDHKDSRCADEEPTFIPDDPNDPNGPGTCTDVDTALNSVYGCDNNLNVLCGDSQEIHNTALDAPVAHDYIFVLVNDAPLTGAALQDFVILGTKLQSQDTVASSFVTDVVLHEFGHLHGILADEYTILLGQSYPVETGEPTFGNVTLETDRAKIKWNHWIDGSTQVPTVLTQNGIPGLYEGAVFEFDIYRPTYNSKMHSLTFPFEQINTEQIIKRIYTHVNPIDSVEPDDPSVSVSTPGTFRVNLVQPVGGLDVRWLLDGSEVGTGAEFILETQNLDKREYELLALVHDPTEFVRYDPDSLLYASHSWTVDVDPVSNVEEVESGLVPKEFRLDQNYPNPFNPSTTIKFAVPKPSQVRIHIYDVLGRVVETLVDNKYEAGTYNVKFDAGNLPAGLYIYRIQADGFTQSRKLILLK